MSGTISGKRVLDLVRRACASGLIVYPKARVARLYHLAADAEEMNDLAADPVHSGRRRALFRRLLAMQKDLADELDLTTAFPDL